MRKGRRTRLAIGLALLLLLIASLLGLEFLTRGASGFPDKPGSAQFTTSEANDQGKASGQARGSAGASTRAFTRDFDGVNSLGASGSSGDFSKIVGDQPDSKTTGASAGSGNPAGTGNFGPAGGSATSGGSGNPNSHGPGSSDPGAGAPLVSAWQPSGGGSGAPFWGGGGTGGSGGPGGSEGPGGAGSIGGTSGSSGSGGSSGAGGSGSRGGGIHETALLFAEMDLGDGPSYTGPIPTSVATVPEPPTIILIVAGVGLLVGAMKIQRARRWAKPRSPSGKARIIAPESAAP